MYSCGRAKAIDSVCERRVHKDKRRFLHRRRNRQNKWHNSKHDERRAFLWRIDWNLRNFSLCSACIDLSGNLVLEMYHDETFAEKNDKTMASRNDAAYRQR